MTFGHFQKFQVRELVVEFRPQRTDLGKILVY